MARTRNADQNDLWFIQTRSAIEEMLRKHNEEVNQSLVAAGQIPAPLDLSKGRYWLETCGAHSAVNAILAIVANPAVVQFPSPNGMASLRPPDALTTWMNTPGNYPTLQAAVPNIDPASYMDNEIAEFYPVAVHALFGNLVECQVVYQHSWDTLKFLIGSQVSVQLCLINPGHFIAVKSYDEMTDTMICIDPWPERLGGGDTWKAFTMTRQDYESNVKPYWIQYRALF